MGGIKDGREDIEYGERLNALARHSSTKMEK